MSLTDCKVLLTQAESFRQGVNPETMCSNTMFLKIAIEIFVASQNSEGSRCGSC